MIGNSPTRTKLVGPWQQNLAFYLSRGAQFVFSGFGIHAFASWYSTTFHKIVIEIKILGLPQVCKLLCGVSKGMLL